MSFLIIPDVHGRDFWKKPCSNITEYDKVIFLGDYLDSYDFDGIGKNQELDNFKEILELSNNNPGKVVLLIGNHDLHYIDKNSRMVASRFCMDMFEEYHKLFTDNIDKFKVIYRAGKYIFTHAGILKNWMDENGLNDIEKFNKDLLDFSKFGPFHRNPLEDISYRRGGNYDSGSCIWADVREHYISLEGSHNFSELQEKGIPEENIPDYYQIFGHTQLIDSFNGDEPVYSGPLINKYFACLDCKKAFVLNNEEKLIEYDKYKN